MKKSSFLFIIFVFCISTNKLLAQADTVNNSLTKENTFAEKPAAKDEQRVVDKHAVPIGATIYPNPVRDVLNIVGLDASAKTRISISSSHGKIVLQSRSSGAETYGANVQKLEPGIYYVTIKENGKSVLLRFLKQ